MEKRYILIVTYCLNIVVKPFYCYFTTLHNWNLVLCALKIVILKDIGTDSSYHYVIAVLPLTYIFAYRTLRKAATLPLDGIPL